MAFVYLCSDDDVLTRLGGEEETRKLAKIPLGTPVSSASSPQLAAARMDATADVQAAFGSHWQIYSANDQAKLVITRTASWLAVGKMWASCASGQAMPEHLRAEVLSAQEVLVRMRRPDSLFGGNPDPPFRIARPIDNSDCGRRGVYSTYRRGGWLGGGGGG